ncbi:10327_t:CDS:2, partial [Diversispora eburnea]
IIELASYLPAIDASKVISPSLVWLHFAPFHLMMVALKRKTYENIPKDQVLIKCSLIHNKHIPY